MNLPKYEESSMSGNSEDGWSPLKIATWVVPGIVLLIPLVAMQFSDEVKWTFFDFVVCGVILYGARFTYEWVASRESTIAYRAAVGMAVVTALILVWINGAVGIIGDGPVNVLYAGVLVVGFIGVLIANFQPLGMARALVATAIAQMLVPVIAFTIWKTGWQDLLIDPNSPHPPFDPGVVQVFILNGVFATMFVGSALLFRNAARGKSERNAV